MIPYSIIKLTIERFLFYFERLYGLNFCILRFSHVYGTRLPLSGDQGVIEVFMNKIINNKKPIIFGKGDAIRDFIHVYDAIEATVLVIEKETKYNLYNIGTGKGYSIIEIFAKIKINPELRWSPFLWIKEKQMSAGAS